MRSTHLIEPSLLSNVGKLVEEDGGRTLRAPSFVSAANSSSITSLVVGRDTCTSRELMAELTAERRLVLPEPRLEG